MKKRIVNLVINGGEYTVNVPVHQTLLETLREQLGMTETKYGCGTGECGACTVIVDGDKSLNACLTLTATMEGRNITTAAGLDENGQLSAVQQAFVDQAAIQCF